MLKRKEYFVDLSQDRDPLNDGRVEVEEGKGNLYSSEAASGKEGWHLPTLDLDIPCELVESSTPGHHHLYIDMAITWDQYVTLLTTLRDVGIIQEGYYNLSMHRKATFLRKPGVVKLPGDFNVS